jgi:S-adenosyl-L-methionine hydrolase (adenosine-forming)
MARRARNTIAGARIAPGPAVGSPPIVLLTDFGARDVFVGVMKGVIAGIAPGAVVVDLTHEVPPQDVRTAAVHLWMAYRYFPPRTVFVSVVDPGVGTRRRILAAETAEGIFLAPDNGLLTRVLRESPPRRVVSVDARRHGLPAVSATFHGRDVFAPVAARVARGLAVAGLGPAVRDWVELPLAAPERTARGGSGTILLVDRFGNAMTDIPGGWARPGDLLRVRGRPVAEVVAAYGDVPRGRVAAVVSSAGTLEIAVNGGSAARRLGLEAGMSVTLIRNRP